MPSSGLFRFRPVNSEEVTGIALPILRRIDTAFAAATPEGGFRVCRVPGRPAYYIGRDATGAASFLVSAPGPGRTVPLRLAGIEARFALACAVAEPGQEQRTETLTAILCTLRDAGTEAYFASVADLLMGVLGDAPTLAAVADAVGHLVELFQRLRTPPRKSLVGLVGELVVIHAAKDAAAAVAAWRSDPLERYDFAIGDLRLEAKASATRRRTHSFSMEQANPPEGIIGILASMLIEQAGGGTSVAETLRSIEARLPAHAAVMRLRMVVADTLGRDLTAALDWCFDMRVARSSLALFDLRGIPAIRGALPSGVSGVRFTSDIDACQPLARSEVIRTGTAARAILPA